MNLHVLWIFNALSNQQYHRPRTTAYKYAADLRMWHSMHHA